MRLSDNSKMLALIGGVGLLLALVVAANLMVRGLKDHPVDPLWYVPGGEPARAEAAIVRYGCGSCHVIPGVRMAQGRVGPELERIVDQVYIAGRLPNTPENLIFWIMHPQHVDSANAMPDLGVTEEDARDIAAYLYTLNVRRGAAGGR